MWKDLRHENWIDRGQWDTEEDKKEKQQEREKALEMWGKK